MREGDDTKQGLSPMIIASLVVAVAIAAVIGTYVTQIVSDSGPVNVVVLKSENTSFKEKPKEVAKQDDAGSNSSVMSMLDELNAAKDEVEVIPLKPDAPEMPEVQVTPEPKIAKPGATPDKQEQVEQDTSQETSQETAENSATDADETAKPIKRPIKPLVIENPVAKGPSMMVQLAAFRDQVKAEEVAALLTEKHKERLQGLSLGIMQADTGSSGIFWRVTTEPLPTEDARNLCDALKRAGQDCIFRKVALQ